ncbi:hypothetical protein [Neisseria sp.]|uniref:hypothetical protein n=1 Tax=Neisseria sp. TaxID=192066 RepID=UPI0026DD288C|nr:hypothetical protein [Neisseria sp.]MDO4907221.1 hypothetical protein [Neisseria sp.]
MAVISPLIRASRSCAMMMSPVSGCFTGRFRFCRPAHKNLFIVNDYRIICEVLQFLPFEFFTILPVSAMRGTRPRYILQNAFRNSGFSADPYFATNAEATQAATKIGYRKISRMFIDKYMKPLTKAAHGKRL